MNTAPQFVRYLVVGLAAAAANILTYALLLYRLNVWYTTAAALSFCVGAVVSFTLHKYWTFKSSSHKNIRSEFLLYVLILIGNGCINTLLLSVAVQRFAIDPLIGNILSNGLVAIWSFFLYKHVTFVRRDALL